MSIPYQFDENALEKLANVFAKIKITSEEKKFLDISSEILQKFVRLSQKKIVCLIWIAFKEWQKKKKMNLIDIDSLPITKQIKLSKEIYEYRKKLFSNYLIYPKNQRKTLESQIDKAYEHHLELFRNFLKNIDWLIEE